MKDRNRRSRRLGRLGIVALFVVAGASVALAQETQLGGKIQAGDQVLISAGETVESDLYASGGQVHIEGTVDGDLLVAAGQVTISGQVSGDVMASAGLVDISGQVMGDVRAAVGQLTVSGSIGEDLFIAAGQGTVAASGEVGEDLVFGNGQMTLDGTVDGDVLGAAGNYSRQGTVAGAENVTINADEAPTVAERSLSALQRLVSIFLVAALFLWLASGVIEEPAQTLRRRPLAALGAGLVGLIGFGVLVVVVILVAVLVGIGAALVGLGDLVGAVTFAAAVAAAGLVLLLFLATVFGAPAWVGVSLGGMALGLDSAARRWAALIVGLVVVVALTSLPVVGGWLALAVVVFGLGALILALRPRRPVAPSVE